MSRWHGMKWKMIIALLVILCSVSCGNGDREILFTFGSREIMTLPAGLNSFTQHVFVRRNIQGNYQNILGTTGFQDDDVKEIQPGRCSFTGVQGDEFFGNIDEVIIRVFNPDSDVEKREVFFRENILLDESGRLELFGSLGDFRDWVTVDEYDLEVIFIFRAVTSRTITFQIDMEFTALGDER